MASQMPRVFETSLLMDLCRHVRCSVGTHFGALIALSVKFWLVPNLRAGMRETRPLTRSRRNRQKKNRLKYIFSR